jgi:hypothetical protein
LARALLFAAGFTTLLRVAVRLTAFGAKLVAEVAGGFLAGGAPAFGEAGGANDLAVFANGPPAAVLTLALFVIPDLYLT